MAVIKSKTKGGPMAPFMADFVPLSQLWEGPNAAYPSEYSARWAMRNLRDELAKAQAVALHRNRLMIHPQRFAQVVEQSALAGFSNRAQSAA